jgi:hypothetical protein
MVAAEMERHALRHINAGRAVFPVVPGGKAPLGGLVPSGFKDATTDPAVFAAWLDRCRDMNLGMPTGAASGLRRPRRRREDRRPGRPPRPRAVIRAAPGHGAGQDPRRRRAHLLPLAR